MSRQSVQTKRGTSQVSSVAIEPSDTSRLVGCDIQPVGDFAAQRSKPVSHGKNLSMVRLACRVLVLLAICLPALAQTPAYDSAGTFYSNGTIATTHDCPLPATINAGDSLWIHTGINDPSSPADQDITINTSDGWAEAYTDGAADRNFVSLWWKIAEGDEDGTNVNFSGASSSDGASNGFYCRSYRFTASGGFAATPYENVTMASGVGTPATVATIAPNGSNRLAIVFRAIEFLANSTMDSYVNETPCDYTQSSEAQGDASTPAAIDMQTATLAASCSGAEDAYGTSASDNFRTIVLGLVPKEAGGQKARRPVVFQ